MPRFWAFCGQRCRKNDLIILKMPGEKGPLDNLCIILIVHANAKHDFKNKHPGNSAGVLNGSRRST